MLKSILAAVLLLVAVVAEAADTLYINRGNLVTIKGTSLPALAFNKTKTFEANSAVLHGTAGQNLDLIIFNNDTAEHGFLFWKYDVVITIPPFETKLVTLEVPTNGGIIFYSDPLNGPSNMYLGAIGMVVAPISNHHSFYWNIREYNSKINDSIARGGSVNKKTYDPDFFTINGLSYPAIQTDTSARILGSVGDTISVFVANTGESMHSIHFHGFHPKCVYSTSSRIKAGWEKDTWALRSMTAVELELVVDKVGLYSVHDHNLVAVSASGTHPNGMFTIMEFK